MYKNCNCLFVLPIKYEKLFPSNVGYFSKIEEFFPYCPDYPAQTAKNCILILEIWIRMPAGHIIYTSPSSLYATVLFKNDGTSAGTISGNILTAVPTRARSED